MKFLSWKKYFEFNQSHFDHVDWSDTRLLNTEEKTLIYSSIRQFQRGEYSEGKHFMKFAKSLHDDTYLETVRLFIKEEQDHAIVLGRFMDMQQIERLRDDWLDNIFRILRKLAGLEGTVTVLLTAEIVSMIYYKALSAATTSGLLRKICHQILADEKMHLCFQSYTLQSIYQRKNILSMFTSQSIRRVLMAGTILMVWWFHRKVLGAGRYSLVSFFRAVWQEFEKCNRMVKGKESTLPMRNDFNHAA